MKCAFHVSNVKKKVKTLTANNCHNRCFIKPKGLYTLIFTFLFCCLGYGDVMYPPRRVRYRASSDSDLIEAEERFDDDDSRLINKFLSHLNQRKRKASERFDCDYEDDAVIQAKRKRKGKRFIDVDYYKFYFGYLSVYVFRVVGHMSIK